MFVTLFEANVGQQVTLFLNRHFSHVTKIRIFKNLNLRKKADHSFCGNFLKSHFRHLKLYSNPPI